MLMGGVCVIALICLFMFADVGTSEIRRAFYGNTHFSGVMSVALRIIALSTGMWISLAVYRYFPASKPLSALGEMTMLIYIGHSFIVEILNRFIATGEMPGGAPALIIYSALIVAALAALARLLPTRLLLNPLSATHSKLTKSVYYKKIEETIIRLKLNRE